ncbi:MAG TPA: sugar transferase [Bryobacteraceae bacterium]|nr:sugar transferase [Bryobacteraceae bacterium]
MGNLASVGPIEVRRGAFTPVAGRTALRHYYRLEPLAALLVAIALAPLAIVLAVIVALVSRRSPLVRHRRVGWRGEELGVIKFRTMWGGGSPPGRLFAIEDLPEMECFIKSENDDRVASPFAAWCRRYSLDEIPQLLHIIGGRMSFVGPRPITRAELDLYYGPSAGEVLSLRPGLTGLWQVMGRSRLSYAQRRRLDLWLVRRASPRLFLALLVRTIPCVLRGYGAY